METMLLFPRKKKCIFNIYNTRRNRIVCFDGRRIFEETLGKVRIVR